MTQNINIGQIQIQNTIMIKKFLKFFIIVDIGVILFCLLQSNTIWLLNTQMAFFSSLIITLGSYFGYKKNIEKRIANTDIKYDNKPDICDKIDDKYDLYSEINNTSDLSNDEIKDILTQEKLKLKSKSNIKNTMKSLGANSSIYRLFGYGGLIVGFFYLNNNQLLAPIPYLVGFLIVPISVLVSRKF